MRLLNMELLASNYLKCQPRSICMGSTTSLVRIQPVPVVSHAAVTQRRVGDAQAILQIPSRRTGNVISRRKPSPLTVAPLVFFSSASSQPSRSVRGVDCIGRRHCRSIIYPSTYPIYIQCERSARFSRLTLWDIDIVYSL